MTKVESSVYVVAHECVRVVVETPIELDAGRVQLCDAVGAALAAALVSKPSDALRLVLVAELWLRLGLEPDVEWTWAAVQAARLAKEARSERGEQGEGGGGA